MPPVRLRALLASAALVLLPVLAFSFTGTATAAGSPTVAATTAPPDPAPTLIPIPSADPTPEPTVGPTHSAAPSPTPSPPALHTAAPKPAYSPKPRATHSQTVTSTASPITGGVELGTLSTPTDSPTPVAVKPASKTSTSADRIGKLIALVVGGALLLGTGGAAGLYLTRHRHDH